jgi:CHAD domain-containing protein
MAYRIGADEPVRAAIARCGREQLDRAIRELSEGINEDPVRAVHDARKAIKKQRSLLRLARGAMPAGERRRENATLREAGRALSGVRDADVLISTVDELSQRFAGQLPAKTFTAIRDQFAARRNSGDLSGALDAKAVQELGSVRLRVDEWELSRGGWKGIDAGLVRSYSRGRRALKRARRSRSLDDLHAWRKRVKDLWYHQRLLTECCGPAIRGQAQDAHRVADLLGDDHDLGLLRDELTRGSLTAAVDLDAVITLIDHRREELQTEALAIGRRLYGERPAEFRRRMRRAFDAGRSVAKAPFKRRPAELAAATREPQHS